MNDQHIASAFDRDLQDIQAQIMKMGGLVEMAILDAADALASRDQEKAEEVRAKDKAVDLLEEQINDDAAQLIALRAPTAIDLRLVLSVLKISANLERIGDYAKNMAKRTSVLAQLPAIEEAHVSLRRMAREVQLMLKDALDAYIQRDATLAMDVIDRDRDIDQLYNALFREFLTFMLEDPRNISACMHLHFIAKNTERMGDHVTAIAEQVVYLVTGEKPEDARDKGDVTSTDANVSDLS
ncbi:MULTISPECIES: phosphate signaling complex protein PhoU [Lentibacter]|jgi:phosphate transport system protein|uniref:Phosphate-specific transport system accessory protein PhoU n=1 Tax=Lentibacter algarum TaxID=576131 RepID=A0A1H3KWF4_9RHOB|nr:MULTISPECIES: phosphate signaling complex protein PhoU [Lentibacter]MCO4777847.1 phosphate signaling complex protein PhoU [Lentibacter algarum]MCO4827598.1 phosphate signaling complex protein PhoU [Lentibacter algarum]MDG1290638.1 phosphate signaling complex protein PhoU [Lentibacter sp.]WIF31701.1 phosphate transport system protein PhoU [Lentibacter algarum]SDY56410.1 phosphate uptake regulator, PhoU [Lentibacter algarum]